ncbi:YlbD family protein [Aquibacillus sediminis]|uniref:YlbD family protein n=1 Tax=Aquibacillus sediminis TaxID=2574734 RepID=UPI001107F3ED|nr:YlbD family protein [Aquibacillus sediminis]
MTNKNLHPSIQEFKAFVKKHPGLIKEVKRNGESWQDYYEKWVLLGEDDPSWEKYKHESNTTEQNSPSKESDTKKDKQELIQQFMKMVENVDLNKVEGHINQLNGAISNIQTLVGQFQEVKKQFPSKKANSNPLNINKD